MEPLRIMLVEDNPADARLTEVALEKTGCPIELHHAENGGECLAMLYKAMADGDPVLPDVVLLDLNMPGRSGISVLEEIKSHEHLGTIPVVVLSSSEAESDVMACYRLHANFFMVKPADFEQSRKMIDTLVNYLTKFTILPGRFRQRVA